MPGTETTGQIDRLRGVSFGDLPPEYRVRAFGVDYGHVSPPEGGDLYLTRYGWPLLAQLLPSNWYTDEWYYKHGERLAGSTGNVYHVFSKPVVSRSADLVVKFSRVAQEVSIVVQTSFPDDVPAETIAAARFNSPMEEFGLVNELRRGMYGPTDLRIRTQRPLAIYAPPEEFQLWQLGRDTSRFHMHSHLLAENQDDVVKAIELDIKRIYVLLYGWIKGADAEQSLNAGDIDETEFYALTPRVIEELSLKGFRVLDNKPKHFILRKNHHDGRALRKNGSDLVYALVDFEFLQRTPEHQKEFKVRQRERYQKAQLKGAQVVSSATGTQLKSSRVFGVDYFYGKVQDGGRLWVVGSDVDLFDYFVPDRWRRTPRVKMSSLNEVYRTRTRDNVHLVYRRSRVGSQPRVDPLTESGRRIREHGYNSPFEEVVIAERLRQMGILTTSPRAIYRTGHQSTKASFLRDTRRFEEHASLIVPGDDGEPVLVSDYDYYTIWDYFRGMHPQAFREGYAAVDLEQAGESGLLGAEECREIIRRTCETLRRYGLVEEYVDEHEFAVYRMSDDCLLRDTDGRVSATLGIDALTAYEFGLIDETAYRHTLKRLETRLRAADCEKLDLKGSHLLLSMNPDGVFEKDQSGEISAMLCNFEFIRGLYRPIR